MVPFSADLLEFASNIGEEDDEEEKPRMALALAGCWNKSLDGSCFGGDSAECGARRPDLQRKREEGEAEEPRCHSPALTLPCLGLARPTRGSLQTPARVWWRQGRFGLFLWAYLLFLSHSNLLQLVMCQDGIGGCKRHVLQMVQT